MLLLKIAGIEFEAKPSDVRKTPKKKLPVLIDDGTVVADSTFIRWHIEKNYDFDFDKHLTENQKAVAWCAEKLCENHLYWMALRERWLSDPNFEIGSARFFDSLPAIMRSMIKTMVRKSITRDLYGQGTARYSEEEAAILASKSIEALSTLLADNKYFMGEELCGADATIYAFLSGAACSLFDSRIREAIEARQNLTDYCGRMTRQFFPETLTA